MSEVVLDTSALLAYLHNEPGADLVEPHLEGAMVSTVNWAEVAQKALERGVAVERLRADIEALGLSLVPFGVVDAEAAARLWAETRYRGLSLGDRACLALGVVRGLSVLTADRAWRELDLGIPIQVVR